MKRLSLLVFVLALGLLAACGGGTTKDVPVSELVEAVDNALGDRVDMVERDSMYLEGMVQVKTDDYKEGVVKTNSYAENVDEYGIFKGADEAQAKALETKIKSYLKLRIDTWMDAYMPEEKPKMQAAECKRVGNYVMYAVLSDDAKSDGFAALEAALK